MRCRVVFVFSRSGSRLEDVTLVELRAERSRQSRNSARKIQELFQLGVVLLAAGGVGLARACGENSDTDLSQFLLVLRDELKASGKNLLLPDFPYTCS